MRQTTLNDALTFAYDNTYRIMSEDELNTVFYDESRDRFGIADDKRHIMIAIYWMKAKPGMGLLFNVRTVGRGIGIRLRGVLPGYKKLNTRLVHLGGRLGFTTAFRYLAGKTSQVGMTAVIKNKRYFYIVYYFAREADGIASHKAFQKVLDTFSFEPVKDEQETTGIR